MTVHSGAWAQLLQFLGLGSRSCFADYHANVDSNKQIRLGARLTETKFDLSRLVVLTYCMLPPPFQNF